MNRARIAAFLSLLLLVLSLADRVSAQTQAPIEPANLPARTVFCLVWRGMPAADVRKANALFALWDDPALAPTRDAMLRDFLNSSKESKAAKEADAKTPPLTAAEWEEYSPLFDNPYIFGFLTNPHKRSVAAASASGAKPPEYNGGFFVYDRTGREALLAKAMLVMATRQKDPPAMSHVTIAGLPALKFTPKTGSGGFYWVEKGKYVIGAGELPVMEEILARLDGKATGESLGASAAFQEAQPVLAHGTIELFLRIPDLKEFAADVPAQQGMKVEPMIDALHMNAIHSIAGSVSFAGPRTHVQGAALGDASAGTVFDIFGDGQASPTALAYASPETISLSSTQFNFLGIYATAKRVLQSVLPKGQQGNADIVDVLAQTRLGMPITEALGILTGEFASLQSSPKMELEKQVYMLGIRNKPGALKLMHTLFSDQIAGETNEGDTTFLKVSLGGGQSRAGVAQFNFYHVAVTPDAILGASKADTLHQLLAQHSASNAAGFAALPQFQAARAQFPQNVDSISYVDFQKFDWPGVKEHWMHELKKATSTPVATAKSLNTQTPKPAAPATTPTVPPAWLERIDPQVFARHLHSSAAASWKDAKGFHFEQWLD